MNDVLHKVNLDSKRNLDQSDGMRLQNWRAPGQSAQSRALNGFLASAWRPLPALIPDNTTGVRFTRRLIARGMSVGSPIASDAVIEKVEQETTTGPVVRGEWVRTGACRASAVILYIHGSGYIVCSSRTHRGLTSRISRQTSLPVSSIAYRLAQGYDPASIVVAGDSAGGHLTVTLALELAREGRALPSALVTLSPVLDLSLRDAEHRDLIERDPFASATRGRRAMARYADANALLDIDLRVDFDGLEAFPPTLVHAGSREMLAADATELARRLTVSGFDVEHRVWPGQMHLFQAMARLPASRAALAEIARFIDVHVPAAAKSRLKAVPA